MNRSIAYFITAHGYGHAVRSSYLINVLGKNNSVKIYTGIPKSFFEEELSVPFQYEQFEFDSGCVQIDALNIDPDATISLYNKRKNDNKNIENSILQMLRNDECDLIISDVVPFAGVIASRLSIPAVTVSNFWWSDIYKDLPKSPEQEILCSSVESDMKTFSHHVVLNPPMRKWESSSSILSHVNLIRTPRNRSSEIREMLGIDSSKHVALLYTGNYGMSSVDWSKLFQNKNWHFIGLHELIGAPSNFTLIDKNHFTMQEFTASVDLVISKLGYGTVTESLASGTPLLYTPREGFSEFPVLENYISDYGHIARIEEEKFNSLKLEPELSQLLALGKRKIRIPNDTEKIAEWILNIH